MPSTARLPSSKFESGAKCGALGHQPPMAPPHNHRHPRSSSPGYLGPKFWAPSVTPNPPPPWARAGLAAKTARNPSGPRRERHVSFYGVSWRLMSAFGHCADLVPCPLMTRSGHRPAAPIEAAQQALRGPSWDLIYRNALQATRTQKGPSLRWPT